MYTASLEPISRTTISRDGPSGTDARFRMVGLQSKGDCSARGARHTRGAGHVVVIVMQDLRAGSVSLERRSVHDGSRLLPTANTVPGASPHGPETAFWEIGPPWLYPRIRSRYPCLRPKYAATIYLDQ